MGDTCTHKCVCPPQNPIVVAQWFTGKITAWRPLQLTSLTGMRPEWRCQGTFQIALELSVGSCGSRIHVAT